MTPSHPSRIALLWGALTLVAPSSWAADDTASSAKSERTGGTAASKKPSSVGRTARAKAKDARARASEADGSGQELVAKRLEKVATIWEKVARHQERAAKLEEEAAKIERETLDLKSKARRAHSLVEQTETRRARALARLRDLGLSEAPAMENTTEPDAAPAASGDKAPKAGTK